MKAIPGYTIVKNSLGQDLYVQTKVWDNVNKLLDAGVPVFLYGPKGTSKTETAEALAISRGFTKAAGTFFQGEFGSVTSGDQLDGYVTMNPTTKTLEMIPSELLKAVRVAGSGVSAFMSADELNRVAVPSALNKLLRLLAQGEYATDLEGVLQVRGNLEFVATANIGYRGTTKLNEALMDRFDAFEMSPIGGDALAQVLQARYPSVGIKDIGKIVKFVDQNRRAAQKDDYEGVEVSTRDALRIARGISIGMTGMEAVETLVGGQVAIAQGGRAALQALVTEAKGQFAA